MKLRDRRAQIRQILESLTYEQRMAMLKDEDFPPEVCQFLYKLKIILTYFSLHQDLKKFWVKKRTKSS